MLADWDSNKDYDTILCAQNTASKISVSMTTITGDVVSVMVSESRWDDGSVGKSTSPDASAMARSPASRA